MKNKSNLINLDDIKYQNIIILKVLVMDKLLIELFS